MPVITRSQVQAAALAWYNAYVAVSNGQSYSMNGRTLTRADAESCYANWQRMEKLDQKHQRLEDRSSGTALADFR